MSERLKKSIGPDPRSASLCISISHDSPDSLLDLAREASPIADILELRLDGLPLSFLTKPGAVREWVGRLVSAQEKPLIVTCRPVAEGGSFDGPENDRVGILNNAAHGGAAFLDLEFDSPASTLRNRVKTGIIVSRHYGAEWNGDLRSEWIRMNQSGADVVKLVLEQPSLQKAVAALGLYDHRDVQDPALVTFSTGKIASVTRWLSLQRGCPVFYCAAPSAPATAEGQADALETVLSGRIREINSETEFYALTGDPVGHSFSPALFNRIFARCDENRRFLAAAVKTPAKDYASLQELGLAGFSVTLPWKEEVIHCLDELDPLAAKIGAVNTVVHESDRWVGFNTDADGFLDPLQSRRIPLAGRRILILGAGGAARAAAIAARDRGACVLLGSRRNEQAEILAEKLGVARVSWEMVQEHMRECDIVVNATPAGMWPDRNNIPTELFFTRGQIAYDLVYRPKTTVFLEKAEAAGAVAIEGWEMLLGVILRQYRLWTHSEPPVSHAKALLLALLKSDESTDVRSS